MTLSSLKGYALHPLSMLNQIRRAILDIFGILSIKLIQLKSNHRLPSSMYLKDQTERHAVRLDRVREREKEFTTYLLGVK